MPYRMKTGSSYAAKPLLKLGYFAILIMYSFQITAQHDSYFPRVTPESQGVTSKAILTFIDSLEQKIDAVHSFIILKNGKQISQGWWDPYSAEVPHVMHSLSKSFTSTAIGFAIDEGLISLDDQVISFFPKQVPEKPSHNLQQMRIRDLITMNTGHIKEPRLFTARENWVDTFLHAEVNLIPGTHFKYNSAATYMLSAIIQKVTSEKLVDYLDPRLFRPLNIEKPVWDISPDGINTGGWGLHIRTEDIAKLGQLYLQKGRWEGKQILSEKWVDMATSPQVSNGSDPNNDWNQGYGFQFWRCRHNSYRGDGAMGQFCIVMPDQNAVIAITSGTYEMGKVMELVWKILLPAMQEKAYPNDFGATAKLRNKTKNLHLRPIEGQSRSTVSKKISKNKYEIRANEVGVETISFNLDGESPHIQLTNSLGNETLKIGSGIYSKGIIQSQLPFAPPALNKIATSGAWTDEQTYQLRIYFYESPARLTYTFGFRDEQILWDSKLEHALFGPRTQERLVGMKSDTPNSINR